MRVFLFDSSSGGWVDGRFDVGHCMEIVAPPGRGSVPLRWWRESNKLGSCGLVWWSSFSCCSAKRGVYLVCAALRAPLSACSLPSIPMWERTK